MLLFWDTAPTLPRRAYANHGATDHSAPGPPHYRDFTIALRDITLGATPVDARRRNLYLTQHSQAVDTNSSGEIQTRNPSKQAIAEPRFRPHGHWDRHYSGNSRNK